MKNRVIFSFSLEKDTVCLIPNLPFPMSFTPCGRQTFCQRERGLERQGRSAHWLLFAIASPFPGPGHVVPPEGWTAALWMLCFLPSVGLFYSPVSQPCAEQGHRMPGGLCILVHLHLFRFNNSNRLLRSTFSLVLLKAQSLRFLIPLLCLSRWKLHHVRVERLMAGVETIDTCPLCAHLPELTSGQ